MRTLVTGLGGFTGRYLAAELAASGHEVVALRADLTDGEALTREVREVRPEWIVHLAGVAFVGHGAPNDFYRVNLMGTRNLLEAAADSGAELRAVLLASSANVYGNRSEGALTEEARPDPANDYAVSKLAMEYMARLWMDRLPLLVVRPFNYTGLGQSEAFLLPKIVAHFRRREGQIELGNLDVWRDFSDVRAVARAYRRLLETGVSGVTLNVCSGRAHSIREILEAAGRLAGYDIKVHVNPAFVRVNEVKVLRGDCSRLVALIGDLGNPPIEETLGWMMSS